MGRNAIRKIIKAEQKWRDKDSKKHRHIFNIPSIVILYHGETRHITYHNVIKCSYCNSFNTVPREGAVSGYISDISQVDQNLPTIKMYTPHKWIIGWTDVILK